MNWKSYVLSLLLAVTFSNGIAQTATAASKKDEEKEVSRALLWKLTGNELAYPSYIFGTIHLISEGDYFLPEGTKKAFDACKQIAFEIDLEDAMSLGSQLALITKAVMNDGVKLSDLLSEEDYKLVNEHFSGQGLPMFLLDRIKPMFLSMFGGGDISESFVNNDNLVSYEMRFMDMANAREMDIHGLETAAYQMSVFDSIPYKDQAMMLVETIRNSETSENNEIEMLGEVYRTQDIEAMYEMFSADEEGLGQYEEVLINQRNRNWISNIEVLAISAPTFIAVGAGHLGGPQGVLKLLQAEGYDLTPIGGE